MNVNDMARLEKTERMMVRWMCGVSLKDRNSSVVLLERSSVKGVPEVADFGGMDTCSARMQVIGCLNAEIQRWMARDVAVEVARLGCSA